MRKGRALTVLGVLVFPWVVTAQTHSVAMTVDDLPFVSGFPSPLSSVEAKKAMQVNETILQASQTTTYQPQDSSSSNTPNNSVCR